uniref:Uncharacterized protein n=1 Tax=Kalanchoe fedtschenkoi TaxID=63787 RepID=A0A7N0TM65_KALFE
MQLKEFPVDACKLRLSALDLSNNSLSGLPAEIGNMTTLRSLVNLNTCAPAMRPVKHTRFNLFITVCVNLNSS